ncbi:MAG: hypothetical protein HFH82_16655 [Lachnospiraceae bacterium]|nr:hypothetical protein [Lachnospiraceae bacterium]
MKFYFLHNHYIPPQIKNGSCSIKSVIVPEFYPDLNNVYLDDPCYFTSVEAYIKYVVQKGYYSDDISYAIENSRIIDTKHIHETLFAYKKLGVKIIQLYCGSDNKFFCASTGLTFSGEQLLSEICETGLILDLSHISDESALNIAARYQGKMIISHCACSDLYSSQKPRSNSLTYSALCKLAEHIEVFGLPFLNDIIGSAENELCPEKIFDDIIAQILTFTDTVGANKVALAPDYLDTGYFSRRFNTKLIFPDVLLKQDGLCTIANRLSESISIEDVNRILFSNVEKLLYGQVS